MEELRRLKRARSTAKGLITKKQNEIKELLLNIENLESIKEKIPELDSVFEEFKAAHEIYHANLSDDCDIDESEEYFAAEMSRVCDLKERIATIAASTAQKSQETDDAYDNVSLSSSSSSSRSSRSKRDILAKKAALKAQAALLKKRQALQEEEFRLKQKMEQLDLETELAKANAEAKAYSSESSSDSESGTDSSDEEISKEFNKETKPTIKPEPTKSPSNPTPVNETSATAKENEGAILSVITAQEMQTKQIENLLVQQQRHTLALMLPQPEVPTFDGNPINYCSFIRSFENLIELKTDSDSARLYYLVQYTSGDVQELMRSCLSMPPAEGYQEARKLLKHRYGQGYKIASSLVNKITESNPIRTESGEALRRFSTLLTSCRNTLKEIGFSSKIENPDTLKRIVDKLPFGLRLKWREVADRVTEKEGREITVDDLASFVEDRARVAAHPIFGDLSSDTFKTRNKADDRNSRRTAVTFATQVNRETAQSNGGMTIPRKGPECPSCQSNHWLSQCTNFRAMSLEERHKLVRNKGLCNNCLTSGHMANSCPKASFCRIDGCAQKHSTFLHPKQSVQESKHDGMNATNGNSKPTFNQSSTHARNGYVKSQQSVPAQRVTALPIVPVKVKAQGSNNIVETYAFLDGGSNTTFCTEKLKRQLDVQGKKTTLSITTIEKANSQTESTVLGLEVSALDGTGRVELPTVFSITSLPVSTESLATQVDASKWSHLEGLVIPSIDADVDLLIGSDVPQALQPEEVKGGSEGEPYAMKTILGWAIVGPLKKQSDNFRTSNFVQSDTALEDQFKMYCNMEFNDALYDEKKTMSQEDKRALKVMEDTIKLKDGHYELSLPWKHEPPNLENNRRVALHRLLLLKKRLARDPKLHQMYSKFMAALLEKEHARKVTDVHVPGDTVWYLPHHPVFHPKKPNKVRVVYDCSAKHQGNALNSELLQGPDLTNSLVGVLTRFREESVALMSDIEEMFYQVRVTEEDRDALRFLWFKNGNLDGDIEEFQMNVHLFGGTSSPSCANFALRKTADDNSGEFSQLAIETVKRNFYVDDCLKSVATEKAAIQLAKELRDLLAKGGFRLTKWMSNSPAVLSSIPEQDRAPSVKTLDFDTPYIERALGIQWNVSSDTFGFTITIKDKPATRRGILSIVSSIYDPLGFVGPFTLPAKMLLQDLCRQKLGWDDPLPESDLQRWRDWLKDLPRLENLSIRRCFKPEGFGEVTASQLHHFSDASQLGYGAVTYLRLVNKDGKIHCSFVCGKSRLAPLKPLTVPRMELSAAVLATKLDKMMNQELSVTLTDESLFWTDSTCVLGYVENECKRFHTFVANRIAAIHDATSPQQWKYVNTESNPADEASRGLPVTESLDEVRWIKGPSFLWQPESTWPKRPNNTIKIQDDDLELKREVTACATQVKTHDEVFTKIFERFSSWMRLKKFIAWMLRLKENLRKASSTRREQGAVITSSKKPVPITVDELDAAEKAIFKIVQNSAFPDEVNALSSRKSTVLQSSCIYNLSPQLSNGLLCVGGRLANAPISEESKHQIILPSKQYVTELLIRHHHVTSGHCGTEYVLSHMRQSYWIVKARSAVRRAVGTCFLCRKNHGKVHQQKMADLPRDRVTPDNPPFTSVGIDFFGPFSVRRGRATVKRYGVLFTCLTVRAVHIEIAHSLDTDSFINTLRRFIARRGPPKEIRTDNGTNFVGGERELREAIQAMNQQAIHEALLAKNVKWTFNPPSGSHHGGVWERCIRSTRKILQALLKEQTIYDETLSTLMCEVEMIMNGRPLTKVSDDPRDLGALTPNHLLLLRPGSTFPPGVFTKEDCYSRRRWRQVQHLADVFWRRWVKEYLPSLQARQKWIQQQPNLKLNDVVLIVDDTTRRNSWPLGRVVEVFCNSVDGLVRSARVKTRTSTLMRPISKLVLLEEA